VCWALLIFAVLLYLAPRTRSQKVTNDDIVPPASRQGSKVSLFVLTVQAHSNVRTASRRVLNDATDIVVASLITTLIGGWTMIWMMRCVQSFLQYVYGHDLFVHAHTVTRAKRHIARC
jgi:hypothetical protein